MSAVLLLVASFVTLVALAVRLRPARRSSVDGYHDAVEALRHAVDRARRTEPVA